MKIVQRLLLLLFFIFLAWSCDDDSKGIDEQKPQIEISASGTFPTNCDTIYFGEAFTLKLLFKDNKELGSFSIDIHNNFDHHSHSTEVVECNMSPKKTPENPFQFTQEYNLEEGKIEIQVDKAMEIPSKNTKGKFDEGDYHFFISLTDKSGWSAEKGLSVKMFYRK